MIMRRNFTRRDFIGGCAAAAAATTLGRDMAHATPSTLTVTLTNKTGSDTVYAYVTGRDPNNGKAWMFLRADGRSVYHPPSPSSTGASLGVDCAIPMGANNSAKTITLPRIIGGRIWFSVGHKLQFLVNPGPGIVMPTVANPSDANISTSWDFCEVTFDDTQLYANITFVDFTALPIAMSLATPQGTQVVRGLPQGGLDTVCARLRQQGGDWTKLIVNGPDGRPLRALSASQATSMHPGLLGGYLDNYINQVWQHYTSNDLTIDTQFSWGKVTGRVANGVLKFPGVGSFTKPSTQAVFNCSLPPFTTANDEMGNISARLAAAFNRTTLLADSVQPTGEKVSAFYQQPQTNHYARILHATVPDGKGYAFPYDDVHPSGVDVEGKVQSGQPGTFSITVGSPH